VHIDPAIDLESLLDLAVLFLAYHFSRHHVDEERLPVMRGYGIVKAVAAPAGGLQPGGFLPRLRVPDQDRAGGVPRHDEARTVAGKANDRNTRRAIGVG